MSSFSNCITLLMRPFKSFVRKLGNQRHEAPQQEQSKQSDQDSEETPTPQRQNSRNPFITSSTQSSSKATPTPNPKIKVRTATVAIPASVSIDIEDLPVKPVTPTRSRSTSAPFLSPEAGVRSVSPSPVANIPPSRASSNGSGVENQALRALLRQRRLECPHGNHNFFIPANALKDLVVVDTVLSNIATSNSRLNDDQVLDYAQKVCQHATKLFAALAYVKMAPSICSLLEEGITDHDLPFVRRKNDGKSFRLLRQSGDQIHTFEEWESKEREKFDRVQMWMIAPVFKLLGHYELDDKAILPFVPFDGMEEMEKKSRQGGYGEVYPVQIHPAHHRFWTSHDEGKEPLVAVKELISGDKKDFDIEASILRKIGSKTSPHQHLIKLLATYHQGGKYHLMFRYADANLREFWEKRPLPSFDTSTIVWSIRQMTGLASALSLIHTFKVTHALKVSGCGEKRVQKDAILSVSDGEEIFGRHGDIKPENILWFHDIPECTEQEGILQLGDFGLGRFHGRDSRSNINPATVTPAPTYEPPECKLHRPVSRAYDLWSMGCLYLEFITWLLDGTSGYEFSEFRAEMSIANVNDDNFFTITRDEQGGLDAKVRDSVVTWVNNLHSNPKCTALIHEILDITMDGLLRIQCKDRYHANYLHHLMKKCLSRAESENDYMLKPAPSTKKRSNGGRSQSESNVLDPSKLVPKRHPSTQEDQIVSLKHFSGKRDLLQRTAGTPGMKQGKSVTWPATNVAREES